MSDYRKQVIRNVRTVDKTEMQRRDACHVMDDLRQDHKRDSDLAEAAHNRKRAERFGRNR